MTALDIDSVTLV